MKTKLLSRNTRSRWTSVIICCFMAFQSFAFQTGAQISGTIMGQNGETLPGVTIQEKGTSNGTTTDINGNFSLNVRDNAVIVISYVGFRTQEISVGEKTAFNITLEEDVTTLDAIVVKGFRGSQQRTIEVKRKATSIVEAITPADIGNYSDENIADAMRRVPGVQVQREDTGGQEGGDRVSIRGIGPQFVTVTVNGRQPLSGGIEGIEGFRQFNLDVLPPEIIQGALIYKGAEADLVEPGLGGLIDFQTIRPLDASYQDDNDFFGAVNVRGEYDQQSPDGALKPRLSAILGGRSKDKKIGAYGTVLFSETQRARDQSFTRPAQSSFMEDTNGNGVWEPGVDTEYTDILNTEDVTLNPLREQRDRLALGGAVQWRPIEGFEIISDFTFSSYDNISDRSQMQPGRGGNRLSNRVFAPGALDIQDGFLRSANTAGAFNPADGTPDEGLGIFHQDVSFDNVSDTWIWGANASYETDGWKFAVDYSISQVVYNQQLVVGARILNADQSGQMNSIFVDGPFTFNGIGDVPNYNISEASQASIVEQVEGPAGRPLFRWNRYAQGDNNALRLDISRQLNESLKLNVGGRWNRNVMNVREVQGGVAGLFDDFDSRVNIEGGATQDFLDGNYGFSQWGAVNADAYRDAYPEVFGYDLGSHPALDVDNVDVFDFYDAVEDYAADNPDEGWGTSPAPFEVEETTFALYAKLDFKTELGSMPLTGNLGARAIRTEYIGRSFTTINIENPDDPEASQNLGFVQASVSSDQWDVTPSLNLKLEINPQLNYRFSVVNTITRPEYTDLAPRGDLTAIEAGTTLFGVQNGSASLPNLELDPYNSWQIDNTVEWYNNYGGAIYVSAFYKAISNYIARQGEIGVSYDEVLASGGFDVSGISATNQATLANQVYDVSQPVNFSNATVYGFELGFNQPLSVLSSSLEGFGVQANYNFVASDFSEEISDIENSFPGSSKHNFNAVAYFENSKFGFRAALNSRSDFLRNIAGGNDVRAFTYFTRSFTQLDLRANYDIIENLQVSLAAQNVLGADRQDFLQNNPEYAFQYITLEPIYTIGVRYGF